VKRTWLVWGGKERSGQVELALDLDHCNVIEEKCEEGEIFTTMSKEYRPAPMSRCKFKGKKSASTIVKCSVEKELGAMAKPESTFELDRNYKHMYGRQTVVQGRRVSVAVVVGLANYLQVNEGIKSNRQTGVTSGWSRRDGTTAKYKQVLCESAKGSLFFFLKKMHRGRVRTSSWHCPSE
jgi:hypothetical protein